MLAPVLTLRVKGCGAVQAMGKYEVESAIRMRCPAGKAWAQSLSGTRTSTFLARNHCSSPLPVVTLREVQQIRR